MPKDKAREDRLFVEISRLVSILQGRKKPVFTLVVYCGESQTIEISLRVPNVLRQYREGWGSDLKFDSRVPGYTASKQDIIDRLKDYIKEKSS